MCHHQQMQMPHLPVLAHGPSMTSLHGQFPPPPLCNPCSSQQQNNFNSVPLPGPSRWGPRTSCPVHSPFRARIPNGTICSGHQVKQTFFNPLVTHSDTFRVDGGVYGREFYRFSFALVLRLTGCSNDCEDDNSREESVWQCDAHSLLLGIPRTLDPHPRIYLVHTLTSGFMINLVFNIHKLHFIAYDSPCATEHHSQERFIISKAPLVHAAANLFS